LIFSTFSDSICSKSKERGGREERRYQEKCQRDDRRQEKMRRQETPDKIWVMYDGMMG
jgi:hypothetical protein